MKTFNKDKIVRLDTVVHCETEQDAIELLNWADSIGLTWISEESYKDNKRWDDVKENTCYYLYRGIYMDIEDCKLSDYNILEFREVILKD